MYTKRAHCYIGLMQGSRVHGIHKNKKHTQFH